MHCDCGYVFCGVPHDQMVLSTNLFVRLGACANRIEHGEVAVVPGHLRHVQFSRPVDFVFRCFVTPNGPAVAHAAYESPEGLTLVTSRTPDSPAFGEVVVAWIVFGLSDLNVLPTWRQLFCSAVSQAARGLYKAALIDYAVAFETFIGGYLAQRLAEAAGQDIAEYLLQRTPRMEGRVKDLLELAVGKPLDSRRDVYEPWDVHVRQPRNALAHGKLLNVDGEAAERAHSAVYQAIRWIEERMPDGA